MGIRKEFGLLRRITLTSSGRRISRSYFILSLLAAIAVSGCVSGPIKFSDLSKTKEGEPIVGYNLDPPLKPEHDDNRARCTVARGAPRTEQGHSLCNALIRVDVRQKEIQKKLIDFGVERFDYSLLFLAVASGAALAAESHISSLQTLGILTATALGLKSYAGVTGRRSAYLLGHQSLSCVREATEGLLWDDSDFYSLRYHRKALARARAKMSQYAKETDANSSLQTKYKDLQSTTDAALNLADEAVHAYGSMDVIVDAKRVELIATMRGRAESARGDIDTIVSSIQNAEAVKRVQNKTVDDQAANIAKEAAANAVDPVAPSLIAKMSRESTMADPDPKVLNTLETAVKPEEGLKNAIAAATYSMQRISDIAPRYIKAITNIRACVIP